MTNEILKEINSIDWNFKGAWTQEGIHGLHWYPGVFIPQIANNLVRLLTSRGEKILDPFCGCGTTLVEAIKLGRVAIGMDCNPMAVLISKVKCYEYSVESLRRKLSSICERSADRLLDNQRHDISASHEMLRDWFSPTTLMDLLSIWNNINHYAENEDKIFFRVCLSHVLKSSSSQEKHWGWVADNVTPKNLKDKDILKMFASHCEEMIRALEKIYYQTRDIVDMQIDAAHKSDAFLHDCRQPIKCVEEVDAIITSPPYPSVIDYTKAHRLSYYLFGWNLNADKEIEIGARWKRTRKTQLDQYVEDILGSFENINRVLKKGGLIGMVIDATKRKRNVLSESSYVDIARLLVEHFKYENLSGYIKRKYSDQRIVDSLGRQNSEHIVILKKT
ncbi:MAG: site-specific DNA-methyltransferase [Phycisphaerae bacterium]|nr:site-specific DNA-methyltransferase [Phycisphaerae bacterium]